MYTVKFTTSYKKSYRLMKKRGLDISLLDEIVDKLRQGKQLSEKHHDHELSGNIPRCRITNVDFPNLTFSIKGSLRNILREL